MIYLTDGKRHLICVPYIVQNLHEMAADLNIKRSWFHSSPYPHYDIPKKRIVEIECKCMRISSKDVVRIARGDGILKHLENINADQIQNIMDLAHFLMSDAVPPPRFDISEFIYIEDEVLRQLFPTETAEIDGHHSVRLQLQHLNKGIRYPTTLPLSVYTECGTTACAVGHGPLMGLALLPNEEWFAYSLRVFGMNPNIQYEDFYFMFGPYWTSKNNTAEGTAKRMLWWIDNGPTDKPWDIDYSNWMRGSNPWFTEKTNA